VDWRTLCSPIEDQGAVGSCTANAAVGLVEYMERRASGKSIDASRLFVYKATRNLLGWHGDTGAYLRTTMEALTLFGAPPERFWAYDGRPAEINPQLDAEPTSFCYAIAENFKAINYMRLDPAGTTLPQVLNNMKNYLAAGFAFMFGLPVYNEFDSPTASGDIAYPAPTSHSRGGHAICAVGYDDNRMIGADKGALLVRNSWGTSWGLNGYAWLSYKYVTSGLVRDSWALISQAWVDTGKFS
jgi:C1A family cysteine protease